MYQALLDDALPLEAGPLENSVPEPAAPALEGSAGEETAGEEQMAALTPAPGSETGPSPAQTLDTRAGRPEDYETLLDRMRPSLLIQRFLNLNQDKRVKDIEFKNVEAISAKAYPKAKRFTHTLFIADRD